MPELLCPKCKRFGMNHEGNGFYIVPGRTVAI